MYFDTLTNTVYLDSFIFSSKTNSILGGVHKDNLFLQNVDAWSSNVNWATFSMQSPGLSGNFFVRIHYKAVNFNLLYNGSSAIEATIKLGYTTYYIKEDKEAWIEQEILDGMTDFYVSISNKTELVIDAYLEIDYFEIVPIFSDHTWTGYEYTLPSRIITSKDITAVINLYGNDTDPELLPIYTLDGTMPTIGNTNLDFETYYDGNNSVYKVSVQTTAINSDTLVNQSVLYMKSLFDRLNGFIPSYYSSKIMYFSKSGLSFYNSLNKSYIDDFSLGAIKLNWSSDSSIMNGWQFTQNGLKTPNILDGSCNLTSGNWPYGFQITDITIVYSVTDQFSGSFRLELLYNTGDNCYTNYLDTSFGEHTVVITGSDVSFPYMGKINLHYDSYAYMGSDLNQQITVHSISFNPEFVKELGRVQIINGVEKFTNSLPTLDWQIDGNWQSYSQPNFFLNDFVLISPKIQLGEYSKFSIEFTSIDCQLSIEWVCLTKGYVLIELDGSLQFQAQIIGYYLPHKKTFDIQSGSHTLSIIVYKYASQIAKDDINSLYIHSIEYQTVTGMSSFNYLTKDDYIVSIENGTVELAEGPYFSMVNNLISWNWDLASTVASVMQPINAFGTTVIGTEVNTMSITIPLDSGKYVTSYGYTSYIPPRIEWTDFSFSLAAPEGYTYSYTYSYSHKLCIDCSWGGTPEQYISYGIDGYRVINWGTYFYFHLPYDYLGNSYSANLPDDISVPDTGTISFSIIAENATYELSHYFTSITLPVPTEEISVELSPIADVVEFPVNIEFTHTSSLEIVYTTDDTDPKTSQTSKTYSSSFELTEPKLIRYCLKPISSEFFLDGEFSKLYLDKVLTNCAILYDVFTIGINKYVKFYTIPWHVPIAMFKSDENGLKSTFYTEPIELITGINNFALTTPVISSIQNYETKQSFTYSFDFFNTSLYSIENGSINTNGDSITFLFSSLYELNAFKPSIIPSVLSGVYYNSFTLSLRSNVESYSIDIMRSDWEPFSEELIDSSCLLRFRLNDLSSGLFYIEQFWYEIKTASLDSINFSLVNRSLFDFSSNSSILIQSISQYIETFSTYITSLNYHNLAQKSIGLLYDDYSRYIVDNNVISLFSDEAMQKPFSFHFSIIIQPNEYILIPDEYTTIYVDSSRFLTYSQDDKVVQFGSKLASNTNCTIVPDMALRLCVESSKSFSEAIKVWTNVPINNYLIVDSDYVQLSNDNLTYTSVLKLSNTFLYIRCIRPVSIELNKSILNIGIKIVAYEEYTDES